MDIRVKSDAARRAFAQRDWVRVGVLADEILECDPCSAEGLFLRGIFEKNTGQQGQAQATLERVQLIDNARYDAAVELAEIYSASRKNAVAARLLSDCRDLLSNSSYYLSMAGRIYSQIGMPRLSWELLRQANNQQPGVAQIQASLAKSAMQVGRLDEAIDATLDLVDRFPGNQHYHLLLARLRPAVDRSHIRQMQQSLASSRQPDELNVLMYYAIGKELEDLGEWDAAFHHFQRAGDAVRRVSKYNVNSDIHLINAIVKRVTREKIFDESNTASLCDVRWRPMFVVGLPRSGTTLIDRILSGHSDIQSAGEPDFVQATMREIAGVGVRSRISPKVVDFSIREDPNQFRRSYLDHLSYRLGPEPFVVDKLPLNVLHLGTIVRAFPDAKLILVQRNPMDSCFAMYKQMFIGAYLYSYSLEDLAKYYCSYRRLVDHWLGLLGKRVITVSYEKMVTDTETATRDLFERVGLDFQDACLKPETLQLPTTTASAVQVREPIHSRSVGHWTKYAGHLAALKEDLEKAGIRIDE